MSCWRRNAFSAISSARERVRSANRPRVTEGRHARRTVFVSRPARRAAVAASWRRAWSTARSERTRGRSSSLVPPEISSDRAAADRSSQNRHGSPNTHGSTSTTRRPARRGSTRSRASSAFSASSLSGSPTSIPRPLCANTFTRTCAPGTGTRHHFEWTKPAAAIIKSHRRMLKRISTTVCTSLPLEHLRKRGGHWPTPGERGSQDRARERGARP